MATRNIVPRADGEGSLGTAAKAWAEIYTKILHVTTSFFTTGDITTTGTISAGNFVGDGSNLDGVHRKNILTDSNFDIWQRGPSFVGVSDADYTADRWQFNYDGVGGVFDITRQDFLLGQSDVPNNPKYYLRFVQSVAGSVATHTDIRQRIKNVSRYAGRTLTLSFWVKAAVNTTLEFLQFGQHFGTGGSPSVDVFTAFDVAIPVSTVWTKVEKTVTVPSVLGKTLGTNGDDHIQLLLGYKNNATQTIDIAQVQLEDGAVATDYEKVSADVELEECEKYYEKSLSLTSLLTDTFPINTGSMLLQANSNGEWYQTVSFRQKKVKTPTVYVHNTEDGTVDTVYNGTAVLPTLTANANENLFHIMWNGVIAAGNDDWVRFHYIADSEIY
jgi:hypothetical protein